jgi:hypothetical protein
MNLVAEVTGFKSNRPFDVSIDLAEDCADFFVSIYSAEISVCVPGKTFPPVAMSRCLR